VLLLGIVVTVLVRMRSTEAGLAQANAYERRAMLAEQWVARTQLNAARTIAIAKAGGQDSIEAYYKPQIKATSAEISALQKELESGTVGAGTQALLARIAERRTTYIGARERMFAALKAGDPAAAQALLDKEMQPAVDAYLATMAEMKDHEAQLAHERLAALESAIARQSSPGHTDLSSIDNRLSAIENALRSRPLGEGIAAIDPALTDRLWSIEQAFGTERSERASAITALSDEITGVRSAVRLAAQNSEQTQASLTEQMQQLVSSLGERIGNIEQTLDAQGQRTNEAHAIYSAELSEVHEALMKISANQHTLAGALDNWRNNDSGEIHLINTRIGAVHEDGARRLAAIEKLCADVETLSHLIIDDKSRPRRTFRQWLFGTEDWVKASWRAPKPWRPTLKWPRVAWRLPLKRRSS